MKLFRNYLMAWWQIGLLKVYVLVVGLLLGSYFAAYVRSYYTLLWIIFAILLVYFLYAMVTDGFTNDRR